MLTSFKVWVAENLKTYKVFNRRNKAMRSPVVTIFMSAKTFFSVLKICKIFVSHFCPSRNSFVWPFISCLQLEIIIVSHHSAFESGKIDTCLCVNVADHKCNMNLEYTGFHIKQIFPYRGHQHECFMFNPALHSNAI